MAGDCKVVQEGAGSTMKRAHSLQLQDSHQVQEVQHKGSQPGTASSQIPASVAERRFTWLLNAARLSRLLVLLQRINGPQDLCAKNTGDAEIYNEVHIISSGINFNK